MITSIKYKVEKSKRDYILNIIQSNGAGEKYRKTKEEDTNDRCMSKMWKRIYE